METYNVIIGVETVICEFCAKKNRRLELSNFFEFHQVFRFILYTVCLQPT